MQGRNLRSGVIQAKDGEEEMGLRGLSPSQTASCPNPSRVWENGPDRAPNQSRSLSPHPLWVRWGDGHKLSVPPTERDKSLCQ